MVGPPPGLSMDPELRLLNRSRAFESGGTLSHELTTAPLFTCDAYKIDPKLFPQRGLLGSVVRQMRTGFPLLPQDKRIYINTNTPSSALVCGVQVCECVVVQWPLVELTLNSSPTVYLWL